MTVYTKVCLIPHKHFTFFYFANILNTFDIRQSSLPNIWYIFRYIAEIFYTCIIRLPSNGYFWYLRHFYLYWSGRNYRTKSHVFENFSIIVNNKIFNIDIFRGNIKKITQKGKGMAIIEHQSIIASNIWQLKTLISKHYCLFSRCQCQFSLGVNVNFLCHLIISYFVVCYWQSDYNALFPR